MDRIAVGRGQRFDLDGRQLVAFVHQSAQGTSRVFDEPAAQGRVRCQPAKQRFNVSVRHARCDCALRSRSESRVGKGRSSPKLVVRMGLVAAEQHDDVNRWLIRSGQLLESGQPAGRFRLGP